MIIQGNNTTYEKCVNCVQGVISPLLANLYLHYLDTAWEEKGLNKKGHDAHIVRYADDCVPRI